MTVPSEQSKHQELYRYLMGDFSSSGGLWSGYWADSSWRNLAAMVACFVIVLSEVELITTLKRRSILSVNVSRKLVRRRNLLAFHYRI